MKSYLIAILLVVAACVYTTAQTNYNTNKFKQLHEELPTPNNYRTASGAPGHEYWQQKADYNISIEIDDDKQIILGEETITYHNQSPDVLKYLWLQLDQNVRAKDAESITTRTSNMDSKMKLSDFKYMHYDFDGGFKLEKITDENGKPLSHRIEKTMVRVDLPSPLKPGEKFSFNVKWWYNINNRLEIGGRSGYEYFEEEDNYLYTIAQFFPRMAVYDEINGWQHKQFLGRGEFALPFGDYTVSITVPADHVVASTGVLQNPKDVLTKEQEQLLEKAKTAKEPIIIISESEARKKEKVKSKNKATWIFKAENVRDFGFASSRKFIWDAIGVKSGKQDVMAMSYYPKEGNPLWERYSTKAVAHTIKWYSHYTFDYPYPTAISVHAKSIGMEYPMICFNFGRPEKDGTYTERTKYGMIGVIIHEVGHNYFPMIVNSDERQWTWMDEGLNSFVQYLTEQQWERNYPSRRGPAYKIAYYMKGDKNFISPIMTNSESIHQFGNNAYGKPATALNILRETVMGREAFDFAFKEYSHRWMFKHPSPADFFRTMEDASAIDLDWFWRGWFYTNDHVDISIDNVKWFNFDTQNPDIEKTIKDKTVKASDSYISNMRNKEEIDKTYDEIDKDLVDFYSNYNPYDVSVLDRDDYKRYKESLSDKDLALLKENFNYYQVELSNVGGLVMPIILEFEYTDGTKDLVKIAAEIWRFDSENVTKVFPTKKEVRQITLDPHLETADTDTDNNYYPRKQQMSKFQLYKQNNAPRENPMQKAERAKGKN